MTFVHSVIIDIAVILSRAISSDVIMRRGWLIHILSIVSVLRIRLHLCGSRWIHSSFVLGVALITHFHFDMILLLASICASMRTHIHTWMCAASMPMFSRWIGPEVWSGQNNKQPHRVKVLYTYTSYCERSNFRIHCKWFYAVLDRLTIVIVVVAAVSAAFLNCKTCILRLEPTTCGPQDIVPHYAQSYRIREMMKDPKTIESWLRQFNFHSSLTSIQRH